ncbi:MAG: N-acetylneuraminate synthase family protein [Spirochaetes bacterium]|nr:N-acetylneuraminate synthase family protein [Spirochaetota bacterium]
MKEKDIKVIAEIGCNHMGKEGIAHEMIKEVSNFCKVDIVKFQKRTPKKLLSPEEYNAFHPNPRNSFGRTYGEHREFLEFDLKQHAQLKKWCEEENVIYTSSVWDLVAAKEIVSLEPKIIKIPSASNFDFEMIEFLITNYPGEIYLSLGMTTKKEEEEIVSFFINKKRNKDVVLFACTSGYPVPFGDICLYEIKRLKDLYESNVKGIGFSGHHLGIAADIAALTLGATYIERHFTLDRTWKGTDHVTSLEPDGLRKLTRDLKNVAKALEFKKNDILDIEKEQRKKLKRKVAK